MNTLRTDRIFRLADPARQGKGAERHEHRRQADHDSQDEQPLLHGRRSERQCPTAAGWGSIAVGRATLELRDSSEGDEMAGALMRPPRWRQAPPQSLLAARM